LLKRNRRRAERIRPVTLIAGLFFSLLFTGLVVLHTQAVQHA